MRILHVIPGLSASTGGPAFGTVEMALALQDTGATVTVYATDIATPAQARQRTFGIQPSDLPPGAEDLDIVFFPVSRPRRFAYSPELRAALMDNAGDYDIVHIHSLFLYPQLVAARVARKVGVPYVVSPHGALDPHLRQTRRLRKWLIHALWQQTMLNRAKSLHMTTELEGQQVAELNLRSPLQVGPYGIGPVWFAELPEPGQFRQRYLDGFAGPLLLFHGRLTKKKGLDILIDAFAKLVSSGLDARLAIVGPDDEHLGASLKKLAQARQVQHSVVFVGILRNHDLRSALSAADIWAMPSYGENFGKAVVEALASGLPIVISPQISIAKEVIEEEAGIVAEATAEAFAQAFVGLLRDPAGAVALGGRARIFAKRFDWNTAGPELARFYEGLLSTGGKSDVAGGRS